MRYWLEKELAKESGSASYLHQLDEPFLLARLMDYADGDVGIFSGEFDVDWYEKQLANSDFKNLMPIASPDGVGWNCFGDNSRIVDCARQIAHGEVDDDTTEFVDVEYIKSIESKLPDHEIKKLIIQTSESTTAPRILDGNHHAVACALHYVKTGELLPMQAYIGVKRIPLVKNTIQTR